MTEFVNDGARQQKPLYHLVLACFVHSPARRITEEDNHDKTDC